MLIRISIWALLIISSSETMSQHLEEIRIKKVKSSSFYQADKLTAQKLNLRTSSNPPENAIDGKETTTWGPNKKYKGEWIEFTFNGEKDISEVRILNGSWGNKGERGYRLNNRVNEFKLTFSNGKEMFLNCNDALEVQIFEIPSIFSSSVRLTILSRYLGTYDLSSQFTINISEVSFHSIKSEAKALLLALKRHDLKGVRSGLKKIQKESIDIAKLNIDSCTPYEFAIKSGNLELVQLFIDSKVDVRSARISKLTYSSSPTDILNFTRTIGFKRNSLKEDMKRLRRDFEPTWEELVNYQSSIKDNYIHLFKEEKELLSSLIAKHKNKAAFKKLKELQTEEFKKPASLKTLKEFRDFETQNYLLWWEIDSSQKKVIKDAFLAQTEKLVNSLIQQELPQLSSFSSTDDGIKKLVTYETEFNRYYSKYDDINSVQDFQIKLDKKKKEIFSSLIEKHVSSTFNPKIDEDSGYPNLVLIDRAFDIFKDKYETYLDIEIVSEQYSNYIKSINNLISQISTNGSPSDQYKLALDFYQGLTLKKDINKAIELFEKSANNGATKSYFFLGNFYYFGESGSKNYKKAFYWYEKSAETGVIVAQSILAEMYRDGTGVQRDKELAFYWSLKAAEQGEKYSQRSVGACYLTGSGTEKNIEKAVYWLKKSAEQGEMTAQGLLGELYLKGDDVEQDLKKFFYWTELAAKQGSEKAQFKIGIIYLAKTAPEFGVERNNELAAYWLKKAKDQGHEDAKLIWNEEQLWKYY